MVFKDSKKVWILSKRGGQKLGMPFFEQVLQATGTSDHQVKREDTALCNYFFTPCRYSGAKDIPQNCWIQQQPVNRTQHFFR